MCDWVGSGGTDGCHPDDVGYGQVAKAVAAAGSGEPGSTKDTENGIVSNQIHVAAMESLEHIKFLEQYNAGHCMKACPKYTHQQFYLNLHQVNY